MRRPRLVPLRGARVTWPDPVAMLRHRGPAVLVGRLEAFTGETLTSTSRDDGPWRWGRMLEGAAQTAGLLAGLGDRVADTAVIAEYRGVTVAVAEHTGRLTFVARLERRVLQFVRCRIEVCAADGTLLLDGSVTLSPAPA